jgi:hypothetical protein
VLPFAEAAALGLSSGPACLASCGPVLLPWLAAERRNTQATALALTEFLAGRLAGYLVFAAAAWLAGAAVPLPPRTRAIVFGAAHIGIALALAWYVIRPKRHCIRSGHAAPLTLGLLTGLNLCAPFLAAAIRAAESPTLAGAIAFFAAYFAGTTVWFLPAIGVASLRRFEALPVVARYTLAVLAAWYAYLGLIALLRSLVHD